MYPLGKTRRNWRWAAGLFTLSLLFAPAKPSMAGESARVSLAAASNLVFALESLLPAFAVDHPAIEVRVTTGASGSLVAQIRHGAPFDLFLSADLAYPQALVDSGHAEPKSRVTYAHGVLCLWPVPPGSTIENVTALFPPHSGQRIALANPDTAPFGRVARAFLEVHSLWDEIAPRAILGENVAQTFHFIRSGNAQIGFVPLSLLTAHPSNRPHLILPSTPPALAHGAVRLSRAKSNPAAQTFLDWLTSPPAQAILQAQGYILPSQVTLDAPR